MLPPGLFLPQENGRILFPFRFSMMDHRDIHGGLASFDTPMERGSRGDDAVLLATPQISGEILEGRVGDAQLVFPNTGAPV